MPSVVPGKSQTRASPRVCVGILTWRLSSGLSIGSSTETLPWDNREPCASLLAHTATQANGNVINRAYYNGYGISIRWQETDFKNPITTAGPTTSTSPEETSASESTSTSVPYEDAHQTDSGLSTGAKAGIGVGAALGGVLLIVGALCLFWQRRKRQAQDDSEADEVDERSEVYSVPPVRNMRDLTGNEQRLAALQNTGYPMEALSSDSHSQIATHSAASHSHSQLYSNSLSQDARSTMHSSTFTPDYANSWHRNINSPAELDTESTSRPHNWI